MTDQPDCPHCGAILDLDDMRRRGVTHCTNCGESLAGADSPVAADLAVGSGLPFAIAPPPAGSAIDVPQARDDRLVVTIPPGGKRARFFGCFAVFWLFVTGIVSSAFFFAGPPDEIPVVAMILFFGLFWMVGLGMLFVFLKMRFTRGYLFLEPDRAVLQTIFFGRKTNLETGLDATSRADLTVSYQENDVNVYRVDLVGRDRTLSFGTAWEEQAKNWFVSTINAFLQYHYPTERPTAADGTVDVRVHATQGQDACLGCGETLWNLQASDRDAAIPKVICPACGCELILQSGEIHEGIPRRRLSPAELGPDHPLSVDHTADGEWTISYRAIADEATRHLGCLFMFALIWIAIPFAFVIGVIPQNLLIRTVGTIVALFFAAPGLLILALGLFVQFGRVQVTLGRDRCAVRWGLGRLGYTRSGPSESLTSVRIVRGSYWKSKNERTSNSDAGSFQKHNAHCILELAGKRVPVTMGEKANLSRDCAAVIRFALDDLGIRLLDE